MIKKVVLGILAMLLMFAVVFAGCDPDGGDTFVAVTDITGGPTAAFVEIPLALAGTVAPVNATNKMITWSVKDAGTTGTTITGSSLTATAAGTTTVTATIANGAAEGTPFTKDFTITVEPKPFAAVTDIIEGPATAAVGMPLTLAGTVEPANATNKTIVWTVKNAGTTGATITGSSLTATATGTTTVTATIADGAAEGTPFTKDFTITVGPFVAVGWIWGDLWWAEAEVGEPLRLNDWIGVDPDNASDKTIIWSVEDAGSTGVTITGNILTATVVGDMIVTATIANGTAVGTPFTASWTVRVKGPLEEHGDFVLRNIQGGKELAQYLGNEAEVTVPGNLGITVLGPGSLRASTITSVVVPEGVTEIDGAFNENYDLTSVTLPQSLEIIRDGSFLICSSMSSITIPSKVTTIENMAFFNCSSLTSMRVEAETPPSVENDLFPRDLIPEGLAAIYVPAASVDAYKAADGWKKHADIITAIIP
jgi:hypothetical protein